MSKVGDSFKQKIKEEEEGLPLDVAYLGSFQHQLQRDVPRFGTHCHCCTGAATRGAFPRWCRCDMALTLTLQLSGLQVLIALSNVELPVEEKVKSE